MRIIVDPAKYEIRSVMRTILADYHSWEDWYCLRIEMQAFDFDKVLQQFHINVTFILETILKDKNATVILSGHDEITLFCKDISDKVLKDMGRKIMYLLFAASGNTGNFTVFDIWRDAAHLTSLYSSGDYTVHNLPAMPAALPHLPSHDAVITNRAPDSAIRKVLLVEDDPVTRWLVRTALKDECHLAVAQDGGKAISLYQSYKPDMVLLDINLPDGDGRDVMDQLMQLDPGAWIVMFSSNDSLENIVGTMEKGARGFIAKPFNRERLLQAMQECPSGR